MITPTSPSSASRWRRLWPSLAILCLVGAVGVPDAGAASNEVRECRKACKQTKKGCTQGFKQQLKDDKQDCEELVDSIKADEVARAPQDVIDGILRPCIKRARAAFKAQRAECKRFAKEECRTCCASEGTACAARCGDTVVVAGEGGEQCETSADCTDGQVCIGCACGAALEAPEECEILNNAECLLPYPSSHFLVPADTPTGFRLHIPQIGVPQAASGPPIPADPLNVLDGFSPTVQIMMHFPQGVDPALSNASRLLPPGCCGQPDGPPWIDTRTYDGRSLDADSPTVLLDADTGERIIHFIEPDARAAGTPTRQALFMRPGKSLTPGHRYIVAMRNLKTPGGEDVVAEPAFAALRDGKPTDIGAIESRRLNMDTQVFGVLEANGIARGDLVLAFDFVVQSEHQLTHQMLAMRDQAYAWLAGIESDPGAISFTINADGGLVENDCSQPGQLVWRRVKGTYQSPLFLDGDLDSDSVQFMNVDENDTPVQNGVTSPPYDITIPCSVLDEAAPQARPVLLGHGLFQTGTLFTSLVVNAVGAIASGDFNYISGATDWRGLSSPDLLWLGSRVIGIDESQLHNFEALPDRLRQGMVNALVLTRMMKRGLFNRHEAFRTPNGRGVFPGATEDVYYYGASLGGIMGTFLGALTPDVERMGIDIPGINFSCMLQRSTQFEPFETLLDGIGITDPLDVALGLGLLHELWVSAEPAGFVRHVTSDPLPGSIAKKILMIVAWLDPQVSNQCTEIAARTLGLPMLEGSLVQGWQGIPDQPGPLDSAVVMYDTGYFDILDPAHQDAIPPLANLPPVDPVCDPHPVRPLIQAGIFQLLDFMQPDGVIENLCDGICDAGTPEERPPLACSP